MEISPDYIYAAIAALSSAIGIMYFRIVKINDERRQAERERLSSEKERRLETGEMKTRLGVLEGRSEGVENLSKRTLEVVHKAISEQEWSE